MYIIDTTSLLVCCEGVFLSVHLYLEYRMRNLSKTVRARNHKLVHTLFSKNAASVYIHICHLWIKFKGDVQDFNTHYHECDIFNGASCLFFYLRIDKIIRKQNLQANSRPVCMFWYQTEKEYSLQRLMKLILFFSRQRR